MNLDIDFTRSEVTEEIVDPDGNALRSEQNTEDLTRETPAKGIPGAVSNTPPQSPDISTTNTTIAGEENLRSKSSSEVKNYEVSRTVSNTLKPSHRIQKINAAVLVREQTIIDPETGAETSAPLADDMMRKIEALVADAIGIDVNRGDSLTVSSSAFINQLEGVQALWYEEPWFRSAINQFAIILILGIVILGHYPPIAEPDLVPGRCCVFCDGGW